MLQAINLLATEKTFLQYILPYFDAILFDDPSMAPKIIAIGKENPKLCLADFLKNVLVSDNHVFHSIIYDAATRILGALFSHFDTASSEIENAKFLTNFLITSYVKEKQGVTSDYVSAVTLTNLLLIPGMPVYFLEHQGTLVIDQLIKKNSQDL